jgi:predicted ATPase with chaperone activity
MTNCTNCTNDCNQGRECTCTEDRYESSWEQIAELLLFALAIVGVVALCALAGFLIR